MIYIKKKLTDMLNPNKFKSCESKQQTVHNKSFLFVPIFALSCTKQSNVMDYNDQIVDFAKCK